MSKQTKRSYQAPALEKGLDIIEFLSSQVAPQSLTEIAASLGRSHNEIYRMLASLEDRHYVLRDEASSRYHLSLKLFHLSHMHSPVEFLRNAAIVPMRRLTETVRQACHLAILSNDTMMVLIRARSPLPVTLSIEEGTRFPLLQTVSGRVLLAFANDSLREDILARNAIFQAQSTRAQRALRKQLEQIREQGYYIAVSEITNGVTDISVPVGIPGSELFAALTMPCIRTRSAECDHTVLLEAALSRAQEIHQAMGLAPQFTRPSANGTNGNGNGTNGVHAPARPMASRRSRAKPVAIGKNHYDVKSHEPSL